MLDDKHLLRWRLAQLGDVCIHRWAVLASVVTELNNFKK